MTTAYATYTYYTTTYLGNQIASADFSRLILRASAQIDTLTFNRAAAIITANTDTDKIDAIKMASCAVAEEIQAVEADGNADGIASETVGSHSVSYAIHSRKQMAAIQKYSDAAATYLSSTGLMFRGFASGEYSGDSDVDE